MSARANRPTTSPQEGRDVAQASRWSSLAALLVVSLLTANVNAQGTPPRAEAPIRHQVSVEARLAFLEASIARQRTHATIWWTSFVATYGLGLVVQSARAAETDDPAARADFTISSIKAVGGLVRLLSSPMGGIESFEPSALGRTSDPGARVRMLREGERVLRHNAERTEALHVWYAHAINVGVNLAGALVLAIGFDDTSRAAVSGLTGIAVGELQILTAPWEADDDLLAYDRLGRPSLDLHVGLAPYGIGPGLVATF